MFGAYTQCPWPSGKSGGVPDPSGRSFVFSLVNATGQAARFSLRDRDGAVAVLAHGVLFGSSGSSLILNFSGRPADQAEGNLACPIDADGAYQADAGQSERDDTFLAGSQWFAAADIEVYEL